MGKLRVLFIHTGSNFKIQQTIYILLLQRFRFAENNPNQKFIGQNKGDKKAIQIEAKKIIVDIIALLSGNYNLLNKTYNELKISPLSTLKECIDYWLISVNKAYKNNSITYKREKNL